VRIAGSIALTIGILVSSVVTASAQSASEGCGQSLQTFIDEAAPGATLNVPACTYRELVTISKPLTLLGHPGAEIRGSDVWTGWRHTGAYWVSDLSVPNLPVFGTSHDGRCAEPTDRCMLPEQVFLDGQALSPIGSGMVPATGQFALNATRNVVLGDDPTGHTVEVTTRRRWIVTESDGVTIDGITMRHAANDAQTGPVSNDGFSNWTLQNSVLSDAHGAVVSVDGGSNNRVLYNDISRGGQEGVHMTGGAGMVVRGNRIHDNNVDGFEWHWEAGGLKATLENNLLLDANEVDHNRGPGLWCDIHCQHVTFSDNRVHDNTSAGIFLEISTGATIFRNMVWDNGHDHPVWGFGAGILVANSADVEVFNNLTAWNARGIVVLSQNRDDAPPEGTVNNFVHENTIVQTDRPDEPYTDFFLAWIHDFPSALFDPASNNRGQNNDYWSPTGESGSIRFEWNGSYRTLSDFAGTPGDSRGRYLSAEEKDQILTAAGIPNAPRG
jgi:parallel beta-helix repeat protein